MAVPARDRTDVCPGVLTTHPADDGPLVRPRVPGGALTQHQLRTLAGCAVHTSDGRLHLTSHANVQLRGITDSAGLARTLADAGLLPSSTHERVRNILVSPLSGIAGGTIDVRPLRDELDHALCADAVLAALPARFQFGIDDGRRDLPIRALDVGWQARGDYAGRLGRPAGSLVLAGYDCGLRVPLDTAVPAMIEAARAFLALRDNTASGAWHLRELDPKGHTIAAAVLHALPDRGIIPSRESDSSRDGSAPADLLPGPFDLTGSGSGSNTRLGAGIVVPPPIGVLTHDAGDARAVHAAVTLGAVTTDQLQLVAELAVHGAVVTPWRSILLPGLAPAAATRAATRLDAAGLVLNPADPSPGVTACIGRPGCASSHADVRADATRVIPALSPSARVHLSGCERRCGRPRSGHVDAVATSDGYTVNGSAVAAPELASAIATSSATTATAPGEPVAPPTRTRTSPHHETGSGLNGYVRDAAEIYRRSFATIRAETARLDTLPPDVATVVVRMIHSCGMVDLVDDVTFDPEVAAAGREALRAGAPVLTDATMIASGITRSRLPADNDVVCTLVDPRVPRLAAELGTTRSAAAVDLWRDRLPGAVVAIGNAPTALFRLFDLLDEGVPAPAAIIGVPVGFIGAAESKDELARRAPAPYLVVRGRRGGSGMAAAAVNAMATEDT